MSIKKILWIAIGLLLVALAFWFIFATSGSDGYDYQGYVVTVQKSGKDTIITTISGNQLSEFIIKPNTKKEYNDHTAAVQVGDHIQLSTKGNSQNLDKFSVYTGYSVEGKLIHAAGLETPLLLVYDTTVKANTLYTLIIDETLLKDNSTLTSISTGTQVKVYYSYPLLGRNQKIVTHVIQPISDIFEPLTEKEITYITSKGYTLP